MICAYQSSNCATVPGDTRHSSAPLVTIVQSTVAPALLQPRTAQASATIRPAHTLALTKFAYPRSIDAPAAAEVQYLLRHCVTPSRPLSVKEKTSRSSRSSAVNHAKVRFVATAVDRLRFVESPVPAASQCTWTLSFRVGRERSCWQRGVLPSLRLVIGKRQL